MGTGWDGKSRMSGDAHVRFCEHLEGRFLRVTRLVICCKRGADDAMAAMRKTWSD